MREGSHPTSHHHCPWSRVTRTRAGPRVQIDCSSPNASLAPPIRERSSNWLRPSQSSTSAASSSPMSVTRPASPTWFGPARTAQTQRQERALLRVRSRASRRRGWADRGSPNARLPTSMSAPVVALAAARIAGCSGRVTRRPYPCAARRSRRRGWGVAAGSRVSVGAGSLGRASQPTDYPSSLQLGGANDLLHRK